MAPVQLRPTTADTPHDDVALFVVDPDTAIAVALAEIEISKLETEAIVAQRHVIEDEYVMRDLSPLGRRLATH